MLTFRPRKRGFHVVWPDETLTDDKGQPGDYALFMLAPPDIVGPKGPPAAGKPRGAWPTGSALVGPEGPTGPGIGRPGPDATLRFSLPDHITSTTSNQAITAGLLSVMPFHTGPAGLSANALAVAVGSTPQSGGTATCYLGIYGDSGDGITPDWATGPLASASPALTASGNAIGAISLELDPSTVYHLAFLYVITDATGHTQPTMTLANGANSRFAGTSPASQVRGFTAAGQTALPTGTGPTLTPAASNIPIVAVRNA